MWVVAHHKTFRPVSRSFPWSAVSLSSQQSLQVSLSTSTTSTTASQTIIMGITRTWHEMSKNTQLCICIASLQHQNRICKYLRCCFNQSGCGFKTVVFEKHSKVKRIWFSSRFVVWENSYFLSVTSACFKEQLSSIKKGDLDHFVQKRWQVVLWESKVVVDRHNGRFLETRAHNYTAQSVRSF